MSDELISIDVLENYYLSDSRNRANFLFEHYKLMPKVLDSLESNLMIIIRAETRHKILQSSTELGIKVQNNRISNPTMDDAIENYEISEAHTERELRNALKGTDNPDLYIREILMIRDTRDDYDLFVNAVRALDKRREEMLLRYLSREMECLQDIAEDFDMRLPSFKKSIYAIKKSVIDLAAEYIDLKSGVTKKRDDAG